MLVLVERCILSGDSKLTAIDEQYNNLKENLGDGIMQNDTEC
jgi:hypothetical protein